MATQRYLVVVYVVTAGLHQDDLGADEMETVLFAWVVVDIANAKVSPSPPNLVLTVMITNIANIAIIANTLFSYQ